MKDIKKVMVGLSGGVDSSVSAYLLKEAGYEVEGVYMRNWHEDSTACTSLQDEADARAVCDQLQINLRTVSFADEYWQHVFTYFLDNYKKGLTPNPDILCNQEIKFKAFLNYAMQNGNHTIATGHYVRTEQNRLLKAKDKQKDQSYFLHTLNTTQLAKSLFPVGNLIKSEVREIAKKIKLKNYAKKDSTGICFIGERKFKTFLNDYLPAKPGHIESLTGEVLGQHDGLMFYTIGQRQGLKIGGQKGKLEAPWYVAKKDLRRNVLVVVQGEHPALYQTTLTLPHIHWINDAPSLPANLSAKIRYRQADQACRLQESEFGYEVIFNIPQRAITPGQSIVFYKEDFCLGGGIIT